MESAVEIMWLTWSDLCHMMSHNQEHLLLAGILTPEFQINKHMSTWFMHQENPNMLNSCLNMLNAVLSRNKQNKQV